MTPVKSRITEDSADNRGSQEKLSELVFKQPSTIDANAFLGEAYSILKDKRIDNILVTDTLGLIGMLDIQDID